jgi:hypothetical protein
MFLEKIGPFPRESTLFCEEGALLLGELPYLPNLLAITIISFLCLYAHDLSLKSTLA